MKKLMTLAFLFGTFAAGAQTGDLYVTGGLYSNKPTNGKYAHSLLGREINPRRGNNYYLGIGGGVTFGKGLLRPGIQMEIDYVSDLFAAEEYMLQSGKRVSQMIQTYYNMQCIRIAPSFIVTHQLSKFKVSALAGLHYNQSLGAWDYTTGVHAGVRAGYKGIMLNMGYSHGFTPYFKADVTNESYIKSRAIYIGLSLHPLAMFKGVL